MKYKVVQDDVLNGHILDVEENMIVALCSTKRPDLGFKKLVVLVNEANIGYEKMKEKGMIEIMENNSEFMTMLNSNEIEPEEIMEKYDNECPSFYTLKDNMKLCNESGDGCQECWKGAIEKHWEKSNE